MGLKTFHLVFILASIALGVFFSVWCFKDYQLSESGLTLGMGIASSISSLGMVAYLSYFLRKLRNVSYFAFLLLLVPVDSFACSVCMGDPNSPMVQSANMAAWVLLLVVGTVLGGFASLFLMWWRRSKLVELKSTQPHGTLRNY